MIGAVVFDLDETLYRERRFALSGFAAAAHDVERLFGVPARDAFSTLRLEMAAGRRNLALQALCRRFNLPARLVEELRWCIRTHAPSLRLPRESGAVLDALRQEWRLGILTNGLPRTQMNKIAALGLSSKVDAVVYAEDTGPGKPDPSAFEAVARALGVRCSDTVFVGDDAWRDVFGARRTGMKTIWLRRNSAAANAAGAAGADADAIIASLGEVPACVNRLVGCRQKIEDETHVAYC